MKLIKFEWSNLFCMGKGAIDLESLGLTLVTGFSEDEGGANGSGKSSLANKGILWTLFGETAGGLRADAVVNRHGKKSCFGQLEFRGQDGSLYSIERHRPAKLSLFKGGTDISGHTAKQTQELIDSLLGFNFETFVQTSVFGQGRLAHYPSLSPKQRKEVLENILPMEEADRWADFTDIAIQKLMPQFVLVAADTVQAETKLTGVLRAMERSTTDGGLFEEQRTIKVAQAEGELMTARSTFQFELDGIAGTAEILKDFDLQAKTDKMSVMNFEAGTWPTYQHDAETMWHAASDSVQQWHNKSRFMENEIAEMADATYCGTCERPFDDASVEAIKRRMEEINAKLKEAYQSIKEAHTAHEYYYLEQKKWHDKIDTAHLHTAVIAGEIEQYKGLEQARELVEAKIAAASAGAQARLDIAKNEENPHVALYERHAGEEEGAKKLLTEAETTNTKLLEELDHLKHWKQVYGKDLKLKLFEDACPFLDSRTSYHLSALKNSQIHCEFSTIKRLATGALKDEFDVVVWSETGGRGFEALSGGEQQMVSFAIGLSLADLASRVGGAESGFLILDEPFTELDERNAEAVIEYLTAEVDNGRDTILLISNDEALKGLIQNRIHVVKKGGISNVSNVGS